MFEAFLTCYSFVIDVCRHIQVNTGQTLDDESSRQVFPSFVWLLRDVLLSLPKGVDNLREYFLEKVINTLGTTKIYCTILILRVHVSSLLSNIMSGLPTGVDSLREYFLKKVTALWDLKNLLYWYRHFILVLYWHVQLWLMWSILFPRACCFLVTWSWNKRLWKQPLPDVRNVLTSGHACAEVTNIIASAYNGFLSLTALLGKKFYFLSSLDPESGFFGLF